MLVSIVFYTKMHSTCITDVALSALVDAPNTDRSALDYIEPHLGKVFIALSSFISPNVLV